VRHRRARQGTRAVGRVLVVGVAVAVAASLATISAHDSRSADADPASPTSSSPITVIDDAHGGADAPGGDGAAGGETPARLEPIRSDLTIVVNKRHPLDPLDAEPDDLTVAGDRWVSASIVADLAAMLAAARGEGVSPVVVSAYRSYQSQDRIYRDYVAREGVAAADTFSARPGYSEHQTGLAIDFGDAAGSCHIADCFADTTEGRWLAEHATEYGFILRYPEGATDVTGYKPEPWHFRFVGRDAAAEMHTAGIATLEEYLGVDGGTEY
jgi:D-alanyl-D-alanine carboxypeptidase